MFCNECGYEVSKCTNYCTNCGNDLKKLFKQEPKISSSSSKSIKSFLNFKKEKTSSRSNIVNKKKNSNDEVVIHIGILKYSDQDLKLKPVRGKKVAIRAKLSSGYSDILATGCEKFKNHYPGFYNDDLEYTLCFESGNEAIFMPGDEEVRFELKKYKDDIGKDYKRITLYLCPYNEQVLQDDHLDVIDDEEENSADIEGLPPIKVKKAENNDSLSSSFKGNFPVSEHKRKRSVFCPTCFQQFPSDIIESHSDMCAQANEERLLFTAADDEEFSRTIEYTGLDVDVSETTTQESIDDKKQFKDALDKLVEAQKTAPCQSIRVLRSRCWEDYVTHCQKKWFNKKLCMQVHFIGEDAVGSAGPVRDFFQDAIYQMKSQCFINGEPVESASLQMERRFYYAGQLLAQSLLQGGPSPNILSEWCFEYICDSNKSVIKPDASFLQKLPIKMLIDAQDEKQYQACFENEEILNLLSDIGYRGIPTKAKLDERENLLESIYYHENIVPKIPALWQLAEGMDIRNLSQSLKLYGNLFKKYFVANVESLGLEEFINLFSPIFSDKGSNKENKEILLYKYFCDFIEAAKYDDLSAIKMEDILKFITGCESLPYGGLESKITIHFKHDCGSSCRCMPIVSLCSFTVMFPIHMGHSFEVFSREMNAAMVSSPGLGRL